MAKPNALPAAVWVASSLTLMAAAGLVAIAVASVGSDPAVPVAWGIGGVLGLWAAIVAAGGVGLLRGRRWSRGPVVAAGLMHLASAVSFAASQPWAWAGALIAAVTIAAALWPSTTAFLGWTHPNER